MKKDINANIDLKAKDDEEVSDDRVKVIMLVKNVDIINRMVDFLRKRDWVVTVVSSTQDLFLDLAEETPDYIFISANYEDKNFYKLPGIIKSTFEVPTIGFAEEFLKLAKQKLALVETSHKINSTVSAPTILRFIQNLEKGDLSSKKGFSKRKSRKSSSIVNLAQQNQADFNARKSNTMVFHGGKNEGSLGNNDGPNFKILKNFEDSTNIKNIGLNELNKDQIIEIKNREEGSSDNKSFQSIDDEIQPDMIFKETQRDTENRLKFSESILDESKEELMEIVLRLIIDSFVNSSDEEYSEDQEMESVKTLGVIPIDSHSQKGFILISGNLMEGDLLDYMEIYKNRLYSALEANTSYKQQLKYYLVDVQELKFSKITTVLPESHRKIQFKNSPLHIVFLPYKKVFPKYDLNSKRGRIEFSILDIEPETEVPFDIYIYFKNSDRYFKYLNSGGILLDKQKQKLLTKGEKVFIEEVDAKHLTSLYISSLINKLCRQLLVREEKERAS